MALLVPDKMFRRVTCITADFLKEQGIKVLVLDVDNTLTGHGSQQLEDDVAAWLQSMKAAGIKMAIASNNVENRVRPFAQRIGLSYTSFSCKPAPFGFMRVRKLFGVKKEEMALVGDQIYTDALGANLYGIRVLLCVPMYRDTKATIRFKRWLEKPVIKRFLQQGGRIIG